MPSLLAHTDVSADQALNFLIEGNERFCNESSRLTRMTRAALCDLARNQRPFATILGCSDSRVAPELIFDAGLGELFVIRVAGNVLSPEVFGSLQYAGAHLHTPLFVVLGHEGCGAVSAALATRDAGTEQRSRIQILIKNILPALPSFDPDQSPAARLSQAVESNVRWSMRRILETPEARMRATEGRMKLIGGIYDISSGRVKFLAE